MATLASVARGLSAGAGVLLAAVYEPSLLIMSDSVGSSLATWEVVPGEGGCGGKVEGSQWSARGRGWMGEWVSG